VVIGNVQWLQDCGVGLSAAARQQRADMEAEGATVVAAAMNGKAVALLGIADSMKPEAPAVLRLLQQRGMQCWMITGDSW
jgi:P-type E1-E2 ATPase